MRINETKVANIANAASVSQIVDLEAYQAIGFYMPAVWTTANLTFLVSDTINNPNDLTDITGFQSLIDDSGAEFVVSAVAGKATGLRFNNSVLLPFRYIVIRSGTLVTPVAQAAARAIRILLRDAEFEQ